ncbi:uncharacterized protein LOC118267729 isoform X2 [Spodoptera frugiperda]|nr:uncharacterized protein LOC118267729 isoform X2 [Spodoptera frugiperda]
MKIIPERGSITYVDDKYFYNASLSVRRNGKRGEYIVNVDLFGKHTIGNNVTIDIIFYEYLHNEFRRSFVEMHFKTCDMIQKDPFVGLIIRKSGLVTCPIPAGKISLKSMSLDVELPSVWPFEKGKGEMIATDNANGKMMIRGELVLTFKQK